MLSCRGVTEIFNKAAFIQVSFRYDFNAVIVAMHVMAAMFFRDEWQVVRGLKAVSAADACLGHINLSASSLEVHMRTA